MTAREMDLQAELDAALARASEIVRREFAQRYRDDPRVWGDADETAKPVAPKRLDSVFSVRMDANTSAVLRRRAEELGIPPSVFLRYLAERYSQPTGWRCQHMSFTTGGSAVLVGAQCPSGCAMQPTYEGSP